ncbi:FAD-dependent oxidoreductase [Mediterraneibacter sp. NSJ-55]|uniref:FAD-dependent oxidoreductase n=1 Tax=Mediterraneibacter hominis TaxID=2763054 RepID=A0A923RPV7_9FIRM|nr:FAD-dependent oxidoreductase [Mediterraneibacter hominis]MBC5688846.1 FAD-dependent oxidoreductase [Mediterraneibacter hominis]
MGRYDALFKPMKIGSLEIRNRIVLGAMGIHTPRLLNQDGSFTEDGISFYERIAEGGTGLLVTSAMMVQHEFDVPKVSQAALDNISEEYIKNSKNLTERIHKHGAKIFLQLSGGTGRAGVPALMKGDPICPSDGLPNVWNPVEKHRALTKDEIQMYIDKFGAAAKKAKDAGFDGVEIHAIHEGYLIDQFTTKYCNTRTDEYGGSLEGRLLFPKKIVESIKSACGQDYPVAVRYSVRSMVKGFNDGAVPGEDFTEVGRDLEEGKKVAKLLESYGYDFLDADNGNYDSWWWAHPPVYMPRACNLEDCAAAQAEVSIPVSCAGRMEQPEIALEAVQSGKVQAVTLARQLVCDPDWPKKLMNNGAEDIRPCISCHDGCLNRIFKSKDLCCALNPAAARHIQYAITPAEKKKNIMVIGGGIGGMEAARVSALRGHKVDLYEKTNELGGMFIAAGAMSFKEADMELIEWYRRQMKKTGVVVHLNTEVTQEMIQETNADEIFVCTGSAPRKLNIPGVENDYVLTAVDALRNPEKIKGNTVVVGGGLTGIEIAYDQARQGNIVTVLEATDKILNVDVSAANLKLLYAEIKYYKIPVITNANITSFENNKVIYAVDEEAKEISADTVILSVGYTSVNPFEDTLTGNHVHVIGDANKVANLMGAIWTAYETAKDI